MKDVSALKQIKLFLFDMDGTLYLGNRLYDFTPELLDTIKKQGKKYLFMTNNSSKSVADYVKKLENLGIKATSDDFMTSSQATSYYLKKHHSGAILYVCGTESLKAELRANGFEITNDIDRVECVVMGFDTELTFKKLEDACILLREDIDYIATNPDWVCPTWYGYVPDCGSVSQMLSNATGRMPLFIGKPQPDMVYMALQKTGFKKEETAIMGDRLYTDIACGTNAGINTIFVLSGEGTMEDVEKSDSKPDFIYKNIKSLYDELHN